MKSPRRTQGASLLSFFESRHDEWISLTEILKLNIAQFGARILELRRDGHIIRNKTEHRDGKVFSWYRLETSRAHPPTPLRSETTGHQPNTFPEFGSLEPERYGV
jgi:hypothetical protein